MEVYDAPKLSRYTTAMGAYNCKSSIYGIKQHTHTRARAHARTHVLTHARTHTHAHTLEHVVRHSHRVKYVRERKVDG